MNDATNTQRYSFFDENLGCTRHCLVVQAPRANARAIVITSGGKVFRVPPSWLKEVAREDSPIRDEHVAGLVTRASNLVTKNRAVQRCKAARTRGANNDLRRALVTGRAILG